MKSIKKMFQSEKNSNITFVDMQRLKQTPSYFCEVTESCKCNTL